MDVVYCFSLVDQFLALKNARWMNELGGCKGHTVIVGRDRRCDISTCEAIGTELSRAFDKVVPLNTAAEIDGWPLGANYFMRFASGYLANDPGCPYFLWLEPDAIPILPGWLNAIQEAYSARPNPSRTFFMGDRVEVNGVPLHMSGIGIYPNPIHAYAGNICMSNDVAWDVYAKDQIVPKAYFTKLIVHNWRHSEIKNQSELDNLRSQHPDMVIFHSDKTGSIIHLIKNENLHQMGSSDQTQGKNETIQESVLFTKPGKIKGDLRQVLPEIQGTEASTDRGVRHGEVQSLQEKDYQTGAVRSLQDSNNIETTSRTSQKLQSTAKSSMDLRKMSPDSTRETSNDNLTCDIFIRTYPKDYPWLEYCLRSISKFANGFRKVWVVSPEKYPGEPWEIQGTEIEWKVLNEECDDHYLSQQIHKLYADVITDYQADYIMHIDSDTVLTKEIRPEAFFMNGNVAWPFTPYFEIQTPWQSITYKFMQREIENEFMRRFPIIVPRWLYGKLREFCYKTHGMIISDYIRNQPLRAFSEFNALGAYAYQFHRDKFTWVDTRSGQMPVPVARQFFSHGGITPEVKAELDQIFSSSGNASMSRVEPARPPESSASTEGLTASLAATETNLSSVHVTPSGIKELPNGLWVLENDTHVSKWVEQQNRLDHDMNLLPFILSHIKQGDTVVDAGAFIGDHTLAYLRRVGMNGTIHAFEPNPMAMQCLRHNLMDSRQLHTYAVGLGSQSENRKLKSNDGNEAGRYVSDDGDTSVCMVPLDAFEIPANFIKLDIEGCELSALNGAEKTIMKHHPKMVIEINQTALDRQGCNRNQIFKWLEDHRYSYKIIQENCKRSDPMYDILCLPIQGGDATCPVTATQTYATDSITNGAIVSNQKAGKSNADPTVQSAGSANIKEGDDQCPVTTISSVTITGDAAPTFKPESAAEQPASIGDLIRTLKDYADNGRKQQVMQTLKANGLYPKWIKKK